MELAILHLERKEGGGGGDLGALLQSAAKQHECQQHCRLLEEGGPCQARRRRLRCRGSTSGMLTEAARDLGFDMRPACDIIATCTFMPVTESRTATQETPQAAQAPMPTREFMSGAPRRSARHPSTRIFPPGPAVQHAKEARQ